MSFKCILFCFYVALDKHLRHFSYLLRGLKYILKQTHTTRGDGWQRGVTGGCNAHKNEPFCPPTDSCRVILWSYSDISHTLFLWPSCHQSPFLFTSLCQLLNHIFSCTSASNSKRLLIICPGDIRWTGCTNLLGLTWIPSFPLVYWGPQEKHPVPQRD